jgi:hypothetical protein
MGKHQVGYARQERDYYPTRERWVTEALLEHIDITDRTVWECATGGGDLAEVLKGSGAARVYCTDIADYGYKLDGILDFTSTENPGISIDAIITNPPGGPRNSTAEAFVEAGLRRIIPRGFLALLLPADFDSAVTRRRFFGDCPHFRAKIVLTRRIVWFERSNGQRAAPKENHAWFCWHCTPIRTCLPPLTLYAPEQRPRLSRNLVCNLAFRQRLTPYIIDGGDAHDGDAKARQHPPSASVRPNALMSRRGATGSSG